MLLATSSPKEQSIISPILSPLTKTEKFADYIKRISPLKITEQGVILKPTENRIPLKLRLHGLAVIKEAAVTED
jgi:hypothetical protein